MRHGAREARPLAVLPKTLFRSLLTGALNSPLTGP